MSYRSADQRVAPLMADVEEAVGMFRDGVNRTAVMRRFSQGGSELPYATAVCNAAQIRYNRG